MKKPANRTKGAEIGRYCLICGRGRVEKLGGIGGFTAALMALGYDLKGQIGFAHIPCISKARKMTGKKNGAPQ